MKYKVNVNWTASVNKIVDIEAESKEEARENVLRRCEEYGEYNRIPPSFFPSMERSAGGISPNNPDSVVYFLEDELCEVMN